MRVPLEDAAQAHLVPGRQLGRGSSCEVVEALDTARGRKVAVKVSLPPF